MKRFTAFILSLAMLVTLLPVGIVAWAEESPENSITVKPFYTINNSEVSDENAYVYYLPNFYGGRTSLDDIELEVSCYGTYDMDTMAQKMVQDMNARPDGTRFINFSAMADAFKKFVEDVIYMDKGVSMVKTWLETFLAKYHALGGKLDGIAVDLEFYQGYAYYVESLHYCIYQKDADGNYVRDENGKKIDIGNKDVYLEIVGNEHYLERVRPKLEARGFDFYEYNAAYPKRSEIWTMYRYDNSGGTAAGRSIWNAMVDELMAEYINEAVFAPLQTYYPDAVLSDYHRMDGKSWYKHVSDSGGIAGSNTVKVGNTSNYNVTYTARPGSSYYDFVTDSATGQSKRTVYMTPPSYNGAVYDTTPFNMALWDVNLLKRTLAVTDTGMINAWITFFNYGPTKVGTISNTPYYSEIILHTGLMDPQPFLGYIRPVEVESKAKYNADPKAGDYDYNIQVVNELMAELTRVAGASDRQPIQTPPTWNGSYILSGMYAGGRNIWRITPDTTKVSVDDFKVKDRAPTFCVDGLTITFPQGRIIEDGKISQVGTCGYWVETPAGINPVITSTADRYKDNPSFAESFETYLTGTFTSASVYPDTYWTVAGTARILEDAGNQALALSGTTTLTNQLIPQRVTAGDEYAKKQAWEVTVTLPADSYGDVTLLSRGANDGILLSGGKAYYYDAAGTPVEICDIDAGTYTLRRELDMRTNVGSYYIAAAGNEVGKAESVAIAALAVPVTTITLSVSNATNEVLLDDYKLYPLGVNTVLELFDTTLGYELTGDALAATRNEDTAYRLSWLNASDQYKIARIYDAVTGATIDTVAMAPGMDGVITGVVEVEAGNSVQILVEVQDGTAPTLPDYDSGDFAWPGYAENLGISCIVAGHGYAKLEDAIAAAASGETVVLIGDAVMDAPAVVADKTITIQGNGKTVTLSDHFSGDYAIGVMAGGHLTLDTDFAVNAGAKTALHVSGGTLNVNGAAVISAGTALLVEQDAAQTPVYVYVAGGVLQGEKAFCQLGENGNNIFVTVTDATITGAVVTEEAFPVAWDGADSFHLHWQLVTDPAVAATCTENGMTEGSHYSCCHVVAVEQQVIPALRPDVGHTWQDATCTDPKLCTYCGAIGADALGHNWNAATCTEPKTCSVCEVTEGEASGHSYASEVTHPTADADGYTTYVCTVCSHSYVANTIGKTQKATMYYMASGAMSSSSTSNNNVSSVALAQGADPVYFVTSQADANNPNRWYMTLADSVPADQYVKFEYPVGGVPTVTLHNATIANNVGLAFGQRAYPLKQGGVPTHTLSYNVVLEGSNSIYVYEYSSSSKYAGLHFSTTGQATISGTGTLTVSSSMNNDLRTITAAYYGGTVSGYGDIIVNDAAIEVTLRQGQGGKTHAVAAMGGDIIVDGGELTVFAIDETKSKSLIQSAFYAKEKAATAGQVGGNLLICNGAQVTAQVTPVESKVVQVDGVFLIDNSSVELGIVKHLISATGAESSLFSTLPILQYADGAFRTVAATTGVCAVTDGALVPSAENIVLFDTLTADDIVTYFMAEPHVHTWEQQQIVAPTCITEGYTVLVCTGCGESLVTDITPVAGHTDSGVQVENQVDPTCTEEGSCEHVKYCLVCGVETDRQPVVLPAEHSWDDATCLAPKTCSVCGETEGEIGGHVWANATCIASKTCVYCGETEGDPVANHTWVSDGSSICCSACGETTALITADIILVNTANSSVTTHTLTNTGAVKYFTTNSSGKVTQVSGDGDYNIRIFFPVAGDTVEIYLKDAYIKRSGNNNYAFTIGSSTNNSFHANIIVEGNNTIEHVGSGTVNCLRSMLADGYTTTITSVNNGTLNLSGNGKNGNIALYSENDVVLRNVTVNAVITPASGATSYKPAVWVKGNVTVDGGALNVSHSKSAAIVLTDSGTSATITGASYDLCVVNGADVTVNGNYSVGVVIASGGVEIDASNVTVINHNTSAYRAVAVAGSGGSPVFTVMVTDVVAEISTDPAGTDPIPYVSGTTAQNYYVYFQTTPL